jgi:hypothetical protein
VLRNGGALGYVNAGDVPLGVNPFAITCCQLDGAAGPDLVTANIIDDSVKVLFNDGSGGFSGSVRYGGLDGAASVACGDLDADGAADVLTGNLTDDSIAALWNTGNGGLSSPLFLSVGEHPSSVTIAGVAGPAARDVVVASSVGATVFLNACAAAGDADNDGDVDLRDVGLLAVCFGETPMPSTCDGVDLDRDSDVDFDDLAEFVGLITGPR